MTIMFIQSQGRTKQKKYVDLLTAVGGLSKLYSDNEVPYLYYRSHENIFCLALDASNEGRGDVSVDAVSGKIGIGLKTFIFKNSQYEKVAEFNKLLTTYKHLSGYDMAVAIAKARNERIAVTSRIYDLNEVIYHCVARKEGKFILYEERMDSIDIQTLTLDSEKATGLSFHDNKNSYRFNFSKSTLFKKFDPSTTMVIDVAILDDPYSILLEGSFNNATRLQESYKGGDTNSADKRQQIILPLYSGRGPEPQVHERSGLNQWNAGGRARGENEVYIPVPAWIHRIYDGFFPPQDEAFSLLLPGNKMISAKICQSGGKALMSNPNQELGEWLLRKVLGVEPGNLVTYEMLIEAGIDSVLVTRNSAHSYEIDFKTIGSYEVFKNVSTDEDISQ